MFQLRVFIRPPFYEHELLFYYPFCRPYMFGVPYFWKVVHSREMISISNQAYTMAVREVLPEEFDKLDQKLEKELPLSICVCMFYQFHFSAYVCSVHLACSKAPSSDIKKKNKCIFFLKNQRAWYLQIMVCLKRFEHREHSSVFLSNMIYFVAFTVILQYWNCLLGVNPI